MNVAGDTREVELPQWNGPPTISKCRSAASSPYNRDDAIDAGSRRLTKAVRFDREGDFRANGAGDDLRFDGAEAVVTKIFWVVEVSRQALRAKVLRPALELRAGELEQVVSVLKGGLEPAGGFAAERKIGQFDMPLDANALQVIKTAPKSAPREPAAG